MSLNKWMKINWVTNEAKAAAPPLIWHADDACVCNPFQTIPFSSSLAHSSQSRYMRISKTLRWLVAPAVLLKQIAAASPSKDTPRHAARPPGGASEL